MTNNKPASAPSNSRTILIVGIILIVMCLVCGAVVAIFILTRTPAPTPTPTVSVVQTETPVPTAGPNVTGNWQGTYTINAPKGCAGYVGTWTATLLEENGVISGSYSSDIGIGDQVSGTSDGANLSWSVGGEGLVTFTGSINITGTTVSGNFTGLECDEGSGVRSTGTFTGNKR